MWQVDKEAHWLIGSPTYLSVPGGGVNGVGESRLLPYCCFAILPFSLVI